MILSHFLIIVFSPYECYENPTQGGGGRKERLEPAERVTISIDFDTVKSGETRLYSYFPYLQH